MKMRLPRRRVSRVAIYLGALLLIAIAIDLVVANARRRIRPGYMTTRIVQPRLPDGSIDYAVALDSYFGRGVTPDNNAAIPLLQALGRQALATNQPPDGVTAALGMPPLPEKGEYFVAHGDYFAAAPVRPTTGPSMDLVQPFLYPTVVTAQTAEWVKANDAALSRIAEATKRPRFFIPLFAGHRTQTLLEAQLRHLKALKEVGAALQARALMRLGDGNAAGFIDDSLALHRLARLLGQGSTMVERVVGFSMAMSAARANVVAAHGGKLSASDARRVIDELSALGPMPTYVDAIDTSERFLGMDVVQVLAKLPPRQAGRLFDAIENRHTPPPWTFHFLPIPYEHTMRDMNHAYDGMLAALRQRSYPERVNALKLWMADVDRSVQNGPYLNLMSADWAISLLLPSLERATSRLEGANVERSLALVALALRAFHAERGGGYPATLAELSPSYLVAPPIDSFVERPLIYTRVNHGYTLYSVGPNMTDDGGRGDDLVANAVSAAATTRASP